MSEIDETLGSEPAYVPPPFEKLCAKVAQLAYFKGNLDKISEGSLTSPLWTIAAGELQKALKEYDEATK